MEDGSFSGVEKNFHLPSFGFPLFVILQNEEFERAGSFGLGLQTIFGVFLLSNCEILVLVFQSGIGESRWGFGIFQAFLLRNCV